MFFLFFCFFRSYSNLWPKLRTIAVIKNEIWTCVQNLWKQIQVFKIQLIYLCQLFNDQCIGVLH